MTRHARMLVLSTALLASAAPMVAPTPPNRRGLMFQPQAALPPAPAARAPSGARAPSSPPSASPKRGADAGPSASFRLLLPVYLITFVGVAGYGLQAPLLPFHDI